MSKVRFPWVKSALATMISMAVLLTPAAQALQVSNEWDSVDNQVSLVATTNPVVENKVALLVTNPTIGWSEASPSPFNPNPPANEKIYFNWRLDNSAGYIKLDIYNGHPDQGGSLLLRTLHNWDYYPSTGYPTYKPSWDGKYNNAVVADGTYYYLISTSATFGGAVTDEEIGTFQVKSLTTPPGTAPVIGTTNQYDSTSYDWATPNPFYPDQNQTTTVNYSLNTSATSVSVVFSKDGQTYGTVSGGTSSGWNTAVWNGKVGTTPLSAGVYTYRITATNNYGTDVEYGSVEIKTTPVQGTAPVIGTTNQNDGTNYDWAAPNPFYPDQNQTTTVNYSLNTAVTSVSVVFSRDGQTYGPVSGGTSSGSNTAVWNGKSGSTPLTAGLYTYRITATNNYGTDTEYGSVEIKTTPVQVTAPTVTGHDVDPSPFDPDTEDACFDVQLDKSANYVTLEIKNGTTTVYGPVNSSTLQSGWNYNVLCWDGENNSNVPVSDGNYTYYLKAYNTDGYGPTVSGTVTVDDEGGSTGTAPIIGTQKGDDSDDYADHNPFDPYDFSKTTIRFKLNTSAQVKFTLSNGSYDVEELTYSANAGTNSIEWDGRKSNNEPYAEGTYNYTIYAWNTDGNDTEHGTVKIDYDGSTGGDIPNITSDYADPDVFDPEDGEETDIHFTIDDDAIVTLEILDGSRVVRTLFDKVNRGEGSTIKTWDGEDKYGDVVEDGDYEYRIKACNNDNECDTAYGDIEVDSDGSSGTNDDLLSNIKVTNPIFDPSEDEETEICFTIERDNTEITVEVMDGSRVAATLLDGAEYDEDYRRCVRWDGYDEDDDDDWMDDDVYQFRVRAEEGNDVQVEYRYIELDTDGIIIGFPDDDDDEYCAGFWDVPKDSPFCKAIELMKFRGIFTGYPDGSFRPYSDINRAEATKVMLLALDYEIMSDDGSNLGFWDTVKRAWYMSYLRTAQRYGIIHGYPDGAFRPAHTMNRVELLKVFLESTDIQVPHCNYAPYADTPLNFETRWYMDYACFAKAYNLMDADYNGNFHPDEPMTRADVAELFYRFEKRGLFAGYNTVYYDGYWNDWNVNDYYSPYGSYYDVSYTYSY